MKDKSKNKLLIIEMITLYVVMPFVPTILGMARYSLLFLLFVFTYAFITYVNTNGLELVHKTNITISYILKFIIRTLFFIFLIYLFTIYFAGLKPFEFLNTIPHLWKKVMILYPIVSVLPQCFMYRTFFEKRYPSIIKSDVQFIWLSALLFSFMHLVAYKNYVAVLFTFLGGLLFATTYKRTKSFWFSAVEQAIYGDAIFTIGLGYYFYSLRWG